MLKNMEIKKLRFVLFPFSLYSQGMCTYHIGSCTITQVKRLRAWLVPKSKLGCAGGVLDKGSGYKIKDSSSTSRWARYIHI